MFASQDGICQCEGVVAEQVHIFMPQRPQPSDIVARNWQSVLLQVVQCVLHINGMPQNDYIGDQAQGTELILLALAVAFTDFTAAAVSVMISVGRNPVCCSNKPSNTG